MMEPDNYSNSLIEIKQKERMLRSSKSRSMTPVIRSASINENSSTTAKNDTSSARISTVRKVVTSSTKSVSKTKTVSGTSSVTVVEKNSSQEKSAFPKETPAAEVESSTHLSDKNDAMELRSERRLAGRPSNRSVANGRGREETTSKREQTRTKTSDYSSDDDDEGEELTHDSQSQRVLSVYRGEYWNKFPKTDFTYSPVSKDHYREVAPGVSVKPNMSRSSYQHLSPASSSRGSMTTTTTSTTTRRSRFFDPTKAGTRVPAYINDYTSPDSDEDEVDSRVRAEVAAAAVDRSALTYLASFFRSVLTVVTTTWTTTWTTMVETARWLVGRNDGGASVDYATPVRARAASRSRWSRTLDYLYVLPAYLTGADMGALASVGEGSRPKRRGLYSALLLLLLLLLSGWWLLWTLTAEEDDPVTFLPLSNVWASTRGWLATFGDWFGAWCGTIGGWCGTIGGWCGTIGAWILLPFAAKQMQQEESVSPYSIPPMTLATPPTFQEGAMDQLAESYSAPPLTVATTPLGATPPTFPADMMDQLVNRLIVSGRLDQLLASGRLDQETTANEQQDVESLAAAVWHTGRLQLQVDAYLSERRVEWLASLSERESQGVTLLRDSLQQQLNDKSQYFEVNSARLAGEVAQLREELERKLNASIAEMKANMRDEAISNKEHRRAQEEEIRILKARLERCCNKTSAAIPWQDVDKYVARYMARMYGLAETETADQSELRALVADMFVGRRQLEAALANVTARHRAEMREASEQSAQTIMDSVSDRISALHVGAGGVGGGGLTGGQVLDIVNRAITTYDADKTGMVDHALESSGGSIIGTRCTESYYKHTASLTLFGIPYWYPVNTPRTVIQPGVHPGECWAFRGSHGFLVVQLVGLVRISSFSIEHIPRSLAFAGNIDSAPKDFSVWGLETEHDLEPTELGKYTYLNNSTSLQYFLVARTDVQPFKMIELRIESNHGNLEYTCLYRFRVHGKWVSS